MDALFNITTRNLSLSSQKGWYDSEDDKTSQLWYKLYIEIDDTRFVIVPYTF